VATALADQVESPWAIEPIPNEDLLYMRVHKSYYRNGELLPIAFRDHERGMSTDWSKYAHPEETRSRARDPSKNGVISMVVEQVRAIEGLAVQHAPLPENRAHANVNGEKTMEVRAQLFLISRTEIPLLEG